MTHIFSTIPLETVAQILTEFQNSSKLAPAINNEVTFDTDFQQASIELSRLYELVKIHPPEVALLLFNEKHVPEKVIELLMIQSKSNNSKHSYAWRLDQSVPNVQAVLLNITDCNTGEVKTMRMDLSTFHKLRYNVSLLMKEHAALDKRVSK